MSLLKNRSLKKWIVGCVTAISIVAPITLLSINWTKLKIVYAAGSSAVAPLMMDLSEAYTKTYKQFGLDEKIELNVAVTGSGAGLESIVNGTKHMGNVSWGPNKSKIKDTPTLKAKTAWANKKIKTLTLGIDGIGVIYKGNFDLDINSNNIKTLYSAVAGVNSYTYGDLIGSANSLSIKPYARAGGAAKSGTTDAFLKDSGFSISGHSSQPYYKMLNTGSYGNNVESTRESNVETWNQISSNGGVDGAITYLSAGFILNNIDRITKSGFRVATYNGTKLSFPEITVNYNWYRPLNTLISIGDNDPVIKKWVTWFTENYYRSDDVDKPDGSTSNVIRKTITDAGVVPLSKNQLESMASITKNYWISDFELFPYDSVDDKFKWGAQN
ncbi:MAG: PstS family phosphate ABC transporter substrate-binding protein [Mycoplasma sp.]